MNKKNLFTAVMILFGIQGSLAQEKEWAVKQVMEQLQHRYEMIDDARGNFSILLPKGLDKGEILL